MVSGSHPLPMPALEEILLHRRTRQAQALYTAHLTWLIGAQLFALGGGKDYPVPDVPSLFPDTSRPRDRRTAEDIRQSVLTRLNTGRKEKNNGQAI